MPTAASKRLIADRTGYQKRVAEVVRLRRRNHSPSEFSRIQLQSCGVHWARSSNYNDLIQFSVRKCRYEIYGTSSTPHFPVRIDRRVGRGVSRRVTECTISPCRQSAARTIGQIRDDFADRAPRRFPRTGRSVHRDETSIPIQHSGRSARPSLNPCMWTATAQNIRPVAAMICH